MKKKQITFLLLGIVGVVLVVGVFVLLNKQEFFKAGIPQGVVEKYKQLSQDKSRLGVDVFSCEENNTQTYMIVANRVSENYSVNFDKDGKELETHSFGDIIDANHPRPTPRVEFDHCTDITNKLK